MSESPRAALERGASLALACLAAFVAVTCGSRGALEHGPIAPLSPNAAPSAALAPSGATSASSVPVAMDAGAGVASPPPTPRASDPTRLELSHFFADLAALEQGQRKESVRITWLGDSHTAADYLTGALRARLQDRFAAGGPGFARVGLRPYRHAQVRWSCDGAWKIEPVPPPRRTPFDDGVLGLGGLRALPDGAPAQASFEVAKGAAHGKLRWHLWYSLAPGATFRLTLGGVSQMVTQASPATELPGAGFVDLALDSNVEDKLELLTQGTGARFFGLTVEGSEPGLVLDAVGIDGARLATALAWGESSFEAALRARAPSLVALAYGTNEAFDADKVEKYRAQHQALLARIRTAVPNADCLIVGPPDATAVAGGPEPRVAEIDALQRSVAGELGCGFISQQQIMGGPGAFSRWARQSPPLARGDRLHLTPKGYETVATAVADKLLEAYGRTPH